MKLKESYIHIRIPEQLKAEAEKVALTKSMNLSEYIRYLLQREIEIATQNQNKKELAKMLKLNIHRVIEGTDEWPLVKIIEGDTAKECFEKAEEEFGEGGGEEYHWTNPY